MDNKHTDTEKIQISRIVGGDEAEFRILYQAFYRPLLFFSRGLIANHEQSEDIVTSVFLTCWERREHFAAIKDVKAYLYAAVRHACYRYITQRGAREQYMQSVDKEPISQDDYIESRIIIAEMIKHIREEIDRLNPIYRDVVRLLFVEELSVKEVAARLAITEENVRKRKERAIELLRIRIVRDNLGNLALFYLIIQSRLD